MCGITSELEVDIRPSIAFSPLDQHPLQPLAMYRLPQTVTYEVNQHLHDQGVALSWQVHHGQACNARLCAVELTLCTTIHPHLACLWL